jgi:hypothetical protein
VRGNDYVYTQPLSAASVSGQEVLSSAAVRFPKGLQFNPLDWAPVTMYSNPQRNAISVLFAKPSQTRSGTSPSPSDSDTALVTWTEREDPHWFGARVADTVMSVEVVRSGANHEMEYHSFGGDGIKSASTGEPAGARSHFITSLHAPQIP